MFDFLSFVLPAISLVASAFVTIPVFKVIRKTGHETFLTLGLFPRAPQHYASGSMIGFILILILIIATIGV
jgi:hypothetical protein